MSNCAKFLYADLSVALGDGAKHLHPSLSAIGVSTDSRTLVNNNLFVALVGERFDAHQNVSEALGKGASACVVNSTYYANAAEEHKSRLIASDNCLYALCSLAWYHRKRFSLPVVAIAGAAGKTSTKDLTAHVLSMARSVLKTEANFNNYIGTSHTLLQLDDSHECAVIEIGTNSPGEIEFLSAMVQPTSGLITNIGAEHLEQLGSLDGVEKEETALFDYLRDTSGLLFVNNDDERLVKYAGTHGRNITFGITSHADVHPTVTFSSTLNPAISMVQGTMTFRAQMQSVGLASARNAVAAIAVAYAHQLTADEIRQGLITYTPLTGHGYGRMVLEHHNGIAVLNDTYNSNPESLALALETIQRYPAQNRIAVLGDMRELGSHAAIEHKRMLTLAASTCQHVVIYGEHFAQAHQQTSYSNVQEATSHMMCALYVRQLTTPSTVVLVKGSRGTTMEKVCSLL
jgi:UDP-N-acetylmuramoyl-tripeptide--D-alanyl-D-alanine ligase